MIFGLLGSNGAGKTTTISMACGVVPRSRGTARIAGTDIRTRTFDAKRAIGLVPQDLALDDELSPRPNLTFFGQLCGLAGGELARRIDGRSASPASPTAPETWSRRSRAA